MSKPDGSHDKLDPSKTSDKTVEFMGDILTPLMEALTPTERKEVLISAAKSLEKHLRVHDPESDLLKLLDQHRREENGFE